MDKKKQALSCIKALEKEYPDAECSLSYTDPLQLIIATRLAAQCTDARVNMVTPALFKRFPDIDAFCEADIKEVEELIHSCGFYHAKAKDIVAMCRMLRDELGGVIPDSVEEPTKLPGVGRKTANLVVGDVFGKPAVVTDTHCIRICGLLGLTDNKVPQKVENDLWEILPPDKANNFCHRLVMHGRAVCVARKPQCEECCMKDYCRYYQSTTKL